MEFQDVNIKCVTCGREFIFTAKEQQFFASKGFKEPRHCRECRQRRKQAREHIFSEATGETAPSGKETYKVICAHCQRESTVPFKPITGKPVLCKDCFIAQRYGMKAPEPETAQQEAAAEAVEPPNAEQTASTDEAISPEIDLNAVKEESQTAVLTGEDDTKEESVPSPDVEMPVETVQEEEKPDTTVEQTLPVEDQDTQASDGEDQPENGEDISSEAPETTTKPSERNGADSGAETPAAK